MFPRMEAKQRFSVLLDDPSSLATSLLKIAQLVAHLLGEHPTDAAQKVRYGGGIVARDVPAPYARELARGLATLGLGSFLVDQAGFAPAPRARRVGQLEFGPEGVFLAQRLRTPGTYAWSDVLAIHAHASLDPTSGEEDEAPARRGGDMTRLSEGARRVLGALREFEDRERARVVLGLDIVVKGPTLFRMTSTDPGIYGSLDALSTVALENYLALVRELTAAAPASVLVLPATRRFVQDLDFTRVLHAKREELEAVNTWLLAAISEGLGVDDGDPEDLPDEGLEDADEAIPLAPGEIGDDEDADDVDDADLDDAPAAGDAPLERSGDDGSADDLADDDLADDDLADGADDPELLETVKLFDKTGRFKAGDVQAMLTEAGQLDAEGDIASADPDADPDVKEAMGFFDTDPSGKWEVRDVLEAAEQVTKDELEAADPKPGDA